MDELGTGLSRRSFLTASVGAFAFVALRGTAIAQSSAAAGLTEAQSATLALLTRSVAAVPANDLPAGTVDEAVRGCRDLAARSEAVGPRAGQALSRLADTPAWRGRGSDAPEALLHRLRRVQFPTTDGPSMTSGTQIADETAAAEKVIAEAIARRPPRQRDLATFGPLETVSGFDPGRSGPTDQEHADARDLHTALRLLALARPGAEGHLYSTAGA